MSINFEIVRYDNGRYDDEYKKSLRDLRWDLLSSPTGKGRITITSDSPTSPISGSRQVPFSETKYAALIIYSGDKVVGISVLLGEEEIKEAEAVISALKNPVDPNPPTTIVPDLRVGSKVIFRRGDNGEVVDATVMKVEDSAKMLTIAYWDQYNDRKQIQVLESEITPNLPT